MFRRDWSSPSVGEFFLGGDGWDGGRVTRGGGVLNGFDGGGDSGVVSVFVSVDAGVGIRITDSRASSLLFIAVVSLSKRLESDDSSL